LFVDPATTAEIFVGASVAQELADIRRDFNSPEEINEEPDTAPSKRIRAVYGRYEKPLYGPLVAGALGLQQIRQACSHFREWLEWLEGLG
jgi:hypothetical protein